MAPKKRQPSTAAAAATVPKEKAAKRGRPAAPAASEGDAAAGVQAGAVFEHKAFMDDNKAKNVVNALIYESILAAATSAIKEDADCFYVWDNALPLQIQEDSADDVGGFMAPFNLADFQTSMATSGTYSAGIPLSWLELTYSPTPGVRLSLKQIKTGVQNHKKVKLAEREFPPLVIGLFSGQNPTHGHLTCLSPEEDRLAFIGGFHELIKEGLSLDERREYRRKLYCVPAKFEIVDSEDSRMFRAILERRTIQKRFMLVKRSAAQIVDEVMCLWARKEKTVGKMTPDRLFALYQSALGDTDSDAGEDGDDAAMNMSKTCIMNAQNVHKHILSEVSLNEIVQKGESLGDQSPFHGLAALKAIQNRCKTLPEKDWVMNMMLDAALTDPDATQ